MFVHESSLCFVTWRRCRSNYVQLQRRRGDVGRRHRGERITLTKCFTVSKLTATITVVNMTNIPVQQEGLIRLPCCIMGNVLDQVSQSPVDCVNLFKKLVLIYQ